MDQRKAQEHWKPSIGTALLAATVATFVSFALANLAHGLYAQQFSAYRQLRTEFAFRPIGWLSPLQVGVYIVVGAIGVFYKRWVIPILVVSIFNPITATALAWSGPQELLDAVRPLMDMKSALTDCALVLNAAFLILYVLHSNRVNSRPGVLRASNRSTMR